MPKPKKKTVDGKIVQLRLIAESTATYRSIPFRCEEHPEGRDCLEAPAGIRVAYDELGLAVMLKFVCVAHRNGVIPPDASPSPQVRLGSKR